MDGGPGGSKSPADDIHSLVLALLLSTRFLCGLCGFVPVPRAARHWDGRRMAGRCGACDGILAAALPRLHERHPAGLMGAWLRFIGAGLRLPVRPDRLARSAVDRNIAGARRGLDSVLREGTRGLGGE